MKTLERYKEVLENKHKNISRQEYIKIFKQNKQLCEIAVASFGMGEVYDTYIH